MTGQRETWSEVFVGLVVSLVISAFSKASLSAQNDELSILLCLPLLASFLNLPMQIRECWSLGQNRNVPWLALSLETWYDLLGRSRI